MGMVWQCGDSATGGEMGCRYLRDYVILHGLQYYNGCGGVRTLPWVRVYLIWKLHARLQWVVLWRSVDSATGSDLCNLTTPCKITMGGAVA